MESNMMNGWLVYIAAAYDCFSISKHRRLCSNFIMKGQLNKPCGTLGK